MTDRGETQGSRAPPAAGGARQRPRIALKREGGTGRWVPRGAEGARAGDRPPAREEDRARGPPRAEPPPCSRAPANSTPLDRGEWRRYIEAYPRRRSEFEKLHSFLSALAVSEEPPPAPPADAPRPHEERRPGSGLGTAFHVLPGVSSEAFTYAALEYAEPAHGRPCAVGGRDPDRAEELVIDLSGGGAAQRGTFGAIADLAGAANAITKTARIPDTRATRMKLQEPGLLMDEAIVLSRLEHPNVVGLFRSFLCSTQSDVEPKHVAVHIMEKCEVDLLLVSRYWPSPDPERKEHIAVTVEFDTLNGLAYLHERGLIHKDIKPANILLSRSPPRCPAGLVAKLADFGSVANSATDQISGTRMYLPPEAFSPQVYTEDSDVWSLFVGLIEFRSGRNMFHSHNPDAADPDREFKRTCKVLFQLVGMGQNPMDAERAVSEGYMRPRDSVHKRPPWNSFIASFLSSLPKDHIVTPGFLAMARNVFVADPLSRPTPRGILNALGDTYFARVGPAVRAAPDPGGPLPACVRVLQTGPNGEAGPRAVREGATVEYESLWYVEPGEQGARDPFEGKLIGGQGVVSRSAWAGRAGPLLYPESQLPVPEQYKPVFEITERSVKGKGSNFVVSEHGPTGATIVTVSVTPRPDEPEARTFASNVKQFCKQARGSSNPMWVPVSGATVERAGDTYHCHFVTAGRIAPLVGTAIGHDYARLVRGFLRLSRHSGAKRLPHSASTVLSSTWVVERSDGGPGAFAFHPALLFYEELGKYDFHACTNGLPYMANPNGATALTPRVIHQLLQIYVPIGSEDAAGSQAVSKVADAWKPLLRATTESALEAYGWAEGPRETREPAPPAPGFSPRLRLQTTDTLI